MASRAKCVKRSRVARQVRGLKRGLAIGPHLQLVQYIQDRLGGASPYSWLVDILDTKQPPAAMCTGVQIACDRGDQ